MAKKPWEAAVLNDKTNTYTHPATGTMSVEDLTICSPYFWIYNGDSMINVDVISSLFV